MRPVPLGQGILFLHFRTPLGFVLAVSLLLEQTHSRLIIGLRRSRVLEMGRGDFYDSGIGYCLWRDQISLQKLFHYRVELLLVFQVHNMSRVRRNEQL